MTDARQIQAASETPVLDAKISIDAKTGAYAMQPLAAAVVAALNPGVAVAQDQDENIPLRLEEIVVTATKREVNLQDVPHAIDVLSPVDIERMGAKSLEDAIKGLPSITLNNTVPGRNSLVIRGISSSNFDYRRDATVAIYLDEQPMTTSAQQVGVRAIDMERIELLSGPQGTLFGSSSQSGTMRYITKKPHHEGVGGNVELRYGMTDDGGDSYDLSGILNVPIVEDVLAVRAVGYTSHDGGYVDNVLGSSLAGNFDNSAVVEEDFNEYDVDGGRIAALWNVTEDWSILASVVGEQTRSDGTWDTDPVLGDYKVTRFIKENRDDDWYSAALTLQGSLGFADLTMNVTTFDRDIAYNWDNNSYAQFKDRWYGGGLYYEQYYAGNPYYYLYYNLPLYNADYIPSTIFNDQHQERDAIEMRLTSTSDSKLQWTAGLFYEDVFDEWYYGTVQPGLLTTTMWSYANYLAYYYGVTSNYYNNYTPNPNISYPLTPTDVSYSNTLRRTVKQTAVFAEVSYDLTDDLTVLGGVRYAEYDRDEFSRFTFPEGLPAGDRGTGDGSFTGAGKSDDTFWKFSVRYNLDDDRMLYGLFSQGVRLGGFNSPRAASTGSVPLVYNPDYLDNYEFGIKSTWADGRLSVNANYFYMEWSDFQSGADFGIWWLRGTVNANAAENSGFEAQVDWQATDRLQLSFNGYIADPKYSDDWSNIFIDGEQQPTDPNNLDIRAGMRMPGAPETVMNVSAYYAIPGVFDGVLWLYADYFYQSESWNNNENILDNNTDGLAPSWSYATLAAGLQLPSDFDIELHVRNAFNDKGYSYVNTGENDDSALFGDTRWNNLRSLSRPRTVWLTLKKRFGGG